MESGKNLIEMIDEVLGGENFELPVPGPVYQQVQTLIGNEEPNVQDLERLILYEQSLTLRVLRVANSAFYGGFQKVTTVRQAIQRLGTNEILNIALLLAQRENFCVKDPWVSRLMEKLWQHSVACAVGAQWVARKSNLRSLQQEAFVAGLLHDVGKVFLLTVIEKMKWEGPLVFPLNEEIIGQALTALHSEYGYLLLKKWGLPEPYCCVAREHHEEKIDPNNELLMVVRLADLACRKTGVGLASEPSLILGARPETHWLAVSEVAIGELLLKVEESLALASL
jgi:HD-like signal output (HDOD) protein